MKGDVIMNNDIPIIVNSNDHPGENFANTAKFLHDVVRGIFPPKNDRIIRVDNYLSASMTEKLHK